MIVPRKAWKARSPKRRSRITDIHGLAVHYSGMNADEQARHSNCARRVRGIQVYHMDTKGWADIAYSFVVCKHGYVFVGRGWGIRTAAQGTNPGNEHYHAVCFLGDDSAGRDDLTPLGRAALLNVIVTGIGRYPDALKMRPHSSFSPTACPGNELRKFYTRVTRLIRVA